MSTTANRLVIVLATVLLAGTVRGSEKDEWKVKREAVFEFEKKPALTRDGDRVTVTFETKGFCDVTVAVEDSDKKIVRHLASGVLGSNAPPPFAKGSKAQTIVWDGKDDQGRYIDDKETLTVRVSLGLKPRFERTLNWSPHRRAGNEIGRGLALRASPEGVYVYDGGMAVDHITLFNHKGDYVRTVYPYPAGKIGEVKGLLQHAFPQDGKVLPVKQSYQMCTLLTSGDNALYLNFKDGHYVGNVGMDPCHKGEYAAGAKDIALGAGGRMAVGANRLNRLATDGSSGGLEVYGPWICQRSEKGYYKAVESAMVVTAGGYESVTHLKPHRMAFSPDGKTLYLTRYMQNFALDMFMHNFWQHGVWRMSYEGDKEPELFLGAVDAGADAAHFSMPSDVACDAKGRVLVADLGNNRVQVFSPDGKLVRSIPVEAPSQVAISPAGELYVTTYDQLPDRRTPRLKIAKPNVLRKFQSVDDPKLLATWDLPLGEPRGKYGQCVEIDFWADAPVVWVTPGLVPLSDRPGEKRLRNGGILLLAMREKSLDPIRSFETDAREAVHATLAPGSNRQRLFWDPRREKLYVGEGGFHFQDVSIVDPKTGHIESQKIPFDAEDFCFDINGLAHIRTANIVGRYDPVNWREVPWDYGEEREKVSYNVNSDRRTANMISGLALPVNSGWHHGGLHVSPRGSMAIGCLYRYGPQERGPAGQQPIDAIKPWTPQIYPGRVTMSVYGCEYIHVWDKHGKLMYEDAVKGLGTLNGVAIDSDDNLYVLSAAPRAPESGKVFNYLAGTLMKFRPDKARIISDDPKVPVPLPEAERPKRAPDLLNLPGNAWANGAEWLYGGVGWHGKNHGLGCGCRNTRFALDYFGRSFAPEMDRYSVAVLDTAGNLILRVGTYGNIEDGKPLVAEGGPHETRSIGGDETSFVHGAYVETQSDRRLFVADIGNYRIASVALQYEANEVLSLKGE
ncbi:MAG: SMP-30/gluconolactonase/LRE family protein [Planctomycetes bacterium]|nr:SMP-30/gluconolactonase/LRE family protein [Planctomycetota bacterium]